MNVGAIAGMSAIAGVGVKTGTGAGVGVGVVAGAGVGVVAGAIAVIALRELLFPYTAQASERLGNMTAV